MRFIISNAWSWTPWALIWNDTVMGRDFALYDAMA